MRIEVTSIEGVAALGDRWDALTASQPSPDPLRRSAWLSAWWRAFGAPTGRREARVLLALEGPRLLGAAPLMLERLPGGLVLMRHLGNSSHWFDPDLLVRPEAPEARLALARAIAEVPCDLVVLEDLAEHSPTIDVLAAAMPEIRIVPQGETRNRYRTLDPPPMQARRKDTRNRMRAAGRAGRELAITTLEDAGEIGAVLDDALDLTQRAWRKRGDASEVTHPAGRRYVHDGIAGLATGQAVLTRVHADGALVAFDLALREGRGAVMFRGNWDPASGVSGAGWMSMLAMIDRLTEIGATEIDFGKFDWPYKRQLASEPRVALVTAALPRGPRGIAAMQIWRARPAFLAGRSRARTTAVRARNASSRLRPPPLGRRRRPG